MDEILEWSLGICGYSTIATGGGKKKLEKKIGLGCPGQKEGVVLLGLMNRSGMSQPIYGGTCTSHTGGDGSACDPHVW